MSIVKTRRKHFVHVYVRLLYSGFDVERNIWLGNEKFKKKTNETIKKEETSE